MSDQIPVIAIDRLVRRYGRTDAVNGLSLTVRAGRCYGFFGRNGAGKTTTIKCLLNLIRPTSGHAKVFGMDPARNEVAVKSRLTYVPDYVAFYPWMTVRDTLDYFAAFRSHWNQETERRLQQQFELDLRQKTSHLSKGQRTQLALITAICPEPELLVLDEPTSGLDPIVRREFIQTVIGAYQEGDPTRRTVFVSTHLISEFEGLIDEFTIIEHGRDVLTLDADAARERYKKIYARFSADPGALDLPGSHVLPSPGARGRDHREWQLGRRAGPAQGAIARNGLGRSAHARRDLRLDAPAAGSRGVRSGAMLRLTVIKEARALFPAWLAAAMASGAVAVIHDRRFVPLLIVAYWIGTAALGAQSIGQEYTHRTLGVMLAQPIDRRRLLALKLGVLTVLLLVLSAITVSVLPTDAEFLRNSIWHQTAIPIIAALCGLFLAPPLTMACRSPLAGIIFSLTIPMCLLIAGEVLAFAAYGTSGRAEMDTVKLAVFWPAMIAICAAGAVLTWRMFTRLEAIEGRGTEIHLPPWLLPARGAADSRDLVSRRHRRPMWLLAKKELRLQQMVFVIVGLYFLMWSSEGILRYFVPDFPLPPVALLSLLYFNLLAIVIGSLASAEERQFGTLESQLLLPVPIWRQWAVKAGIALGLALVLGIGVPVAVDYVSASGRHFNTRQLREMTLAVVLMTSFGLYLSSLCTSGVRALVYAVAVVVGAMVVYQFGEAWAWRAVMRLLPGPGHIGPGRGARLISAMDDLSLLMSVGVTALLLLFGFVNHRSAERSSLRTVWQVTWVAGFSAWIIILRVAAYTYYRLTPPS